MDVTNQVSTSRTYQCGKSGCPHTSAKRNGYALLNKQTQEIRGWFCKHCSDLIRVNFSYEFVKTAAPYIKCITEDCRNHHGDGYGKLEGDTFTCGPCIRKNEFNFMKQWIAAVKAESLLSSKLVNTKTIEDQDKISFEKIWSEPAQILFKCGHPKTDDPQCVECFFFGPKRRLAPMITKEKIVTIEFKEPEPETFDGWDNITYGKGVAYLRPDDVVVYQSAISWYVIFGGKSSPFLRTDLGFKTAKEAIEAVEQHFPLKD